MSNRQIVIFLIIFSALIWWPTRFLPYYWDSSGYIITTAKDIYSSNFTSLSSRHTDFAHPSLIPVSLAIFWKLLGPTRLVSHLVMFPYLPFLMIGTYFWLKHYLKKPYAFLGAVLIGSMPAVLAEYVNVYSDLPAAALTAMSLWLITTKYKALSIIVFTLALLTKLPVITILPYFYFHLSKKQKLLLVIPILTIVSWLIYHYFDLGWWLVRPGRRTATPQNLTNFIDSTVFVLKIFFIDQGKIIWLLLPLAFLATQYQTLVAKIKTIPEWQSLLLTIAVSLAFFVYVGEFAERYGLYAMPFFILLIMYSLQKFSLSVYWKYALAGVMLVSNVANWHPQIKDPNAFAFRAPSDLSIMDSIQIFRELAMYLQTNASAATVYGAFPENVQLLEPLQGYVANPVDFKLCNEFAYDQKKSQMIIIHPYSPSQYPCIQLLDNYSLTPTQRFEQNGKWVELYTVEATAAAKETQP